MCFDPVTMIAGLKTAVTSLGATFGGLGTAATIGGGVLTAYSQLQSAKVAQKTANMNAKAQDQAALDAINAGKDESDRRRRANAAIRSENIAGMAANAVDVGGLGATDIINEQRLLGEEDAFAIRENARKQGQNFANAAANSRAEASQAKSDAFFRPVTTLLGTAAKVGKKYSYLAPGGQQQTSGAFG